MTRYMDGLQRGTQSNKPTGTDLLFQEEVKTQRCKSFERTIAKLIAPEFFRAMGEAVKNKTTEFDYLTQGLPQVYAPKFPVVMQVVRPQRRQGKFFPCRHQHPETFLFVGHFIYQQDQNLNRTSRPAMLVGSHPRLGRLVVTDLKMDPDIF